MPPEEVMPDERIELDKIYAMLREALKQGIPLPAIQAELDSAYLAYYFQAFNTITEHERKRGAVN